MYTPEKPSINDKVWTIDFLSLVFSDLSTATSENGKQMAHPLTPQHASTKNSIH